MSEFVGWFEALGNSVPDAQRQAAIEEAREMGWEVADDAQWVHDVADAVQTDSPEEAIDTAREHLNLTGTYRFLAALCQPVEEEDTSDAPTITFGESAAETIISGFGWTTDFDNIIVNAAGEPVESTDGDPIPLDKLGGIIPDDDGNPVLVRDDFASLAEHVKERMEAE